MEGKFYAPPLLRHVAGVGVGVRAKARARVRFMYFQRPYIKFPLHRV